MYYSQINVIFKIHFKMEEAIIITLYLDENYMF